MNLQYYEDIKRKADLEESEIKRQILFREKNGFPCLYFPLIERTGIVEHLFTTRLGGVSEGFLGTTNISYTIGDNPEYVRENFNRIGKALGVSPENMVCSQQTHTTNIRIVTEEDRGKGTVKHRGYKDVDGLMTNIPGICLVTYYADCVPLYFVDPVHKAIAVSHSGWRGTVSKMGEVTIRLMEKTYGTDPRDLVTAIGPSICQDCYEVSEDVIEKFREAFPEEKWEDIFYGKPDGKYKLNLWEACRYTQIAAGVKPEHIAVAGVCTACNSEYLFSHRASKGKRGLLGAFMALKK